MQTKRQSVHRRQVAKKIAAAKKRDQKFIDKIPNPNIPMQGQLRSYKALTGTQTSADPKPVRWIVKDGIPVSRLGKRLLSQQRATKADAVTPKDLPR
jgi:hypothetical protein